MTGSAAQRPGRPSASSVSTFVLSLLTAAVALLAATLQTPLDLAAVALAADAGWSEFARLPDPTKVTLACYAAVALSLTMTFPSLRAVFASRRAPDRLRTAATDGRQTWIA